MLSWSNAPPRAPSQIQSEVLQDQSMLYSGTKDSPYPSPELLKPRGNRSGSDYVGKGRLSEAIPKKRTDALAEAWGVAEPEPFEEFLAGGGSGRASAASSVYGGKDSHVATPSQPMPRRGRDARDLHGELAEDSRPQRPSRRSGSTSKPPPPQPLALPGELGVSQPKLEAPPLSSGVGATTKRSRSLMQRIRKMRETPNIPFDDPSSELDTHNSMSTSNRPTHRPSNSFLGRLGRGNSHSAETESSTVPLSEDGAAEDESKTDDGQQKFASVSLPSDPTGASERNNDVTLGDPAVTPGVGLERRTSLMSKVVRGVKRATRT